MSARNVNLWPVFIFGLPACVVVASFITIIIAFKTADSPVSDNAYKDGLAINKSFKAQQAAESLAIVATMRIEVLTKPSTKDTRENKPLLSVSLHADSENLPETITAKFEHPLQEQYDFSLTLIAEIDPNEPSDIWYRSPIPEVEGRWYVTLSGREPRHWEIKSEVRMADLRAVALKTSKGQALNSGLGE